MNPRYAVIRAQNFAVRALRRGDPALAGRPLAVVEGDGRKAAIIEVSAEAMGAEPGLPMELAVARCPGLILRPRDPAMEVEAQRLLLAAAFALSPRVEATAAGVCTVDLQGADPERLPGALRRQAAELDALGLPVRIGAGPTPWVAGLASRTLVAERASVSEPLRKPGGFRDEDGAGVDRLEVAVDLRATADGVAGGTTAQAFAVAERASVSESLRKPGGFRYEDALHLVTDLAAFLSPLPLALAEPSAEQAGLLARWGLRTFGELTALPKAEISRRWGAAGEAVWERAAGESLRVLRLVAPARTFAAEWSYEPPVESIEPLFFRLRRFAERIALELRGAGFVAEQLALTLLLEDESEYRREFRLPEPSGDVDGWLRVLHAHLESVRTAARVGGVRLVARPARPALKQDGLFDTGLADPHAFWENLARLGAIVGSDRVGTPVPAGSHRPDAFTLEKPAEAVPPPAPAPVHPPRGPALRRFRPPRPVPVALAGSRPARVGSSAVRAVRGPWLTSGEWWTERPWAIEIWEVEMEEGGVYRLICDEDGWKMEGMLD